MANRQQRYLQKLTRKSIKDDNPKCYTTRVHYNGNGKGFKGGKHIVDCRPENIGPFAFQPRRALLKNKQVFRSHRQQVESN